MNSRDLTNYGRLARDVLWLLTNCDRSALTRSSSVVASRQDPKLRTQKFLTALITSKMRSLIFTGMRYNAITRAVQEAVLATISRHGVGEHYIIKS